MGSSVHPDLVSWFGQRLPSKLLPLSSCADADVRCCGSQRRDTVA